jgi:hypothetical protein
MAIAGCAALAAGSLYAAPARALTIDPYFDSSITSAANAASVEFAIDTAISTIDSLYTNNGTVNIVFTQASGSFVGESETADYAASYADYVGLLSATSAQQPTNTVLTSALGTLSTGNQPGSGGSVLFTTADAQIALGLGAADGVTGCFTSGGSFVSACGQSYVGVVTLSSSVPLNYTTTAVGGEYSAISGAEHEIDEMLGGGGQGSVLNAIADGLTAYDNDVGVLDLYRYAAPGVASFSTSGSATAYLSVDGGVTDIVGFNQNSSGDFADFGQSGSAVGRFSATGDVQSAFGSPGILPSYTPGSPEFIMMEAIGYDGVVPEPTSLGVLGSAMVGLVAARRRVRRRVNL